MEKQRDLKLNIIAASTVLSGLLALSSTLFALIHVRRVGIVLADAHLTVIAGISLIYLASLLRRGKFNAWLISLGVYLFLILRNFQHFVIDFRKDEHFVPAALNLLIPIATLAALIIYRDSFTVRSGIRSFAVALRRAVIVLLVAFLYGLCGFMLLDEKDFHTEISLPLAVHYTVDQSGFTTANQPTAHTKRARFFVDSLAAISITSVTYVAVSFFAPVRFRLSDHSRDYEEAGAIIARHALTSEDFFKLWPKDKAYFFNPGRTAVIAYRVSGGVALVAGDPLGPKDEIRGLLREFLEYCRLNDWGAAFIHTQSAWIDLYKSSGFSVQKIGEEALVDVGHFTDKVLSEKYFRHINNKFSKLGYRAQMLVPPHSDEAIAQLRAISIDWLQQPGRAERGFMMGYFSEEYLQQCPVMVVRDEHGEIKAFANQIPSPKDSEASYDFLRHASGSPGNINDFLMINLIQNLHEQGIGTLNMGLCPLSGLGSDQNVDRSALDSLLNFIYSNAGRFYSFQGLRRFKSKYEPDWQDRYIVYSGGMPGLTKSMNALLRAMTRLN